jgi:hypothetical protein
MHVCSLFLVFPFSLRFCSFKPTPSLLINIGKTMALPPGKLAMLTDAVAATAS